MLLDPSAKMEISLLEFELIHTISYHSKNETLCKYEQQKHSTENLMELNLDEMLGRNHVSTQLSTIANKAFLSEIKLTLSRESRCMKCGSLSESVLVSDRTLN